MAVLNQIQGIVIQKSEYDYATSINKPLFSAVIKEEDYLAKN